MNRTLVIGSAAKDIFFPTDEGVILETPEDITAQRKIAFELGAKYHIKKYHETLGGCSVNVACGLARLEESVECYFPIGDDTTGEWIEKELNAYSIDIKNIEKISNSSSDLSAIIVDNKSGERTIFSSHGASEKFEVKSQKIGNPQLVFISDLSGEWKNNLTIILDYAKKNNIKIALNPRQQMLHEDIKFITKNISACEIIFVNKDEAIEIISSIMQLSDSEINDEKFLIKKLKEMEAKIVVITDGIRGAWGFDGRQIMHVDALVRKAVDTTGSGDAFASAFLAAHLKGKDLTEALKWGIINSSNSVTEYGGQRGLLTQEKIENLLSQINVEKL